MRPQASVTCLSSFLSSQKAPQRGLGDALWPVKTEAVFALGFVSWRTHSTIGFLLFCISKKGQLKLIIATIPSSSKNSISTI